MVAQITPAETAQVGPRIALVVAFIVAVACLWLWATFLRRKRLIQDIPTSSAAGVALGLNELVGTAESAQSEPAPQTGIECVWWKNEFYVENGDNGWKKTKERQGGPISFLLRDDTGAIPVRPRKAEVSAPKAFDGPYSSFAELHRDPDATLVTRYLAGHGSQKKRRVVERVIKAGDTVYVLGTAQLPWDDLDVYVGPDREGTEPFFVRVGDERDALFGERIGTGLGATGALAASAAGGVAWADGQALASQAITWSEVGYRWPVACVVACLAAMGVGSLVFVYNGLLRLRQRAAAAWSLIDVQLRRRHDLIPNLAEVAQAHAGHEHAVQTAVAQLRSSIAPDLPERPSDDAVAGVEDGLRAESLALGRALAVIEAYPEITADASFAGLRAELVDTENRVAMARTFYNNSVLALHDRASTVFGGLVAWVFELDLDVGFTEGLGGRAVPSAAVSRQPRAPESRSDAMPSES